MVEQIPESDLPHKDCPRCGTSVLRTETAIAYIMREYNCQRCEKRFIDVCDGECEECQERNLSSCDECSKCMFGDLKDNYERRRPRL